MHRFFISAELLQSETVTLPPETARQVSRVLRMREGERVVLFCGDGMECEAVLTQVGSSVVAEVRERRRPEVELGCHLHVAVAVLKGEKLDWVVQKLTELGAGRISFLTTGRTVVEAGSERWSRRSERYARIAREAVEQCGRVRLPEIGEPASLEAVLRGPEERKLFLAPGAEQPLARAVGPETRSVLLLIGPEGGFTDAELRTAVEAGAEAVSLGRRILRAETAALAAAAVVTAQLER